MKPVRGWPALKLGKRLILADLHLGIEYELKEAGIRIPNLREELERKVRELLELTRCQEVLVLGDLKHKIPGLGPRELKEIPRFLQGVGCPVKLIPGNHDGGIAEIAELELLPVQGIRLGRNWLCHGHANPPEEAWRLDRIIIAHSHPVFEFRDSLGYLWTEPGWVVSDGKPEIWVLPAFNHWAGGLAVNKNPLLGPVAKRIKKFDFYLLDGTLLKTVEQK